MANRFIDLMESTIQKVAENPEHYAVVYKDYGQFVIRPFSHIVTYRIKSHAIEILAITHGSRDPKIWKQRK